MKLVTLLISGLIVVSSSSAYASAEMYDRTNLWYGTESNFDEVWSGILASMQPPSNVVAAYHAFQTTNKIPVLAEVMESNRAYALGKGLNPSVITWSDAEYRSLVTPPLLEEGETPGHQRGRHLMALMGVPHADETALCENWTLPTNIIVNGQSYSVTTDSFEYIHAVLSANPSDESARGRLFQFPDAREARISGFMQRITSLGTVNEALNLSVVNLDPATNMMFLCSKHGSPSRRDVLIYKNLVLHMYAPTNAPFFAAAIINAGLPENERIPLSPTQ